MPDPRTTVKTAPADHGQKSLSGIENLRPEAPPANPGGQQGGGAPATSAAKPE